MIGASYSMVSQTLGELFRGFEGPPFSIRLWDGWIWRSSADSAPVCTIALGTPKALRSLLLEGSQVALGEAFIRGDLEVEGDLFSAFEMAEHVVDRPVGWREAMAGKLARTAWSVARIARHGARHSEQRDGVSVSYHYDQPVEFFRRWLGPTLVYSCAYFRDPMDTLDEAQMQKMELICRKLRLEQGERFLDLGCGWGSLILYAAQRHRARASGITLSRAQAEVAGQRIAQSGLGACCRVRFKDYRSLAKSGEVFDKMSSVGMYEHVGLKNLPRYFETAFRLLRPGGCFLNHGIARAAGSRQRGSDSFIARYVFPDGDLVTLTETIAAAERAGFEVRDVENLREHYELTLRRWVEGLQRNRETLRRSVPETTYRTWLLYMAGSAAAFRRAELGLYQVLLISPEHGRSGLPLRREDWYRAHQ